MRSNLHPNSLAKCPGKELPILSLDAEGGILAGKGCRVGSGALTVLKPEPCWYGPCVSMISPGNESWIRECTQRRSHRTHL